MTKVTVTPASTPEKSSNGGKQLVHVTDLKGRTLGLRRLDFLEEFRIMDAVGPQLAANTAYMGMLNPLLYLAEIDGEPVAIPRNINQVEALIQRAGREGFIAVVEGIRDHFATDQKAMEEKIKNLQGTPDSETDAG